MFFNFLEDTVQTGDVHIGRIDEGIQLHKLIPDFLFENGLRSNGEPSFSNKIGLVFVGKVRIGL